MAYNFDELEINPFYIALQTKYIDLYENAQKHCYHLCVPQDGTFNEDGISKDFVESHILRPSPYFKGQFMTTHVSKNKTIVMSENGQYFTALHGSEEEVPIKILFEELAYNKDYQQYRILILEKPLDPKFELKESKLKEHREKQLHTHKITVRECSEFLKSFPEFKQSLANLDKQIEYFYSHYMVLPDYLDDAATRLKVLSSEAQKEMLKHLKPNLIADSKLREVLAAATESYLMNEVYHKVFVVVRQRFTQVDQHLLSKCHKLNRVRPEQIGVRAEFSCPLPSAVIELANVDSLLTPREKLTCLKSVVDNVTKGITAYLAEKRRETQALEDLLSVRSSAPNACITSDDLIPILVMVIAKAKCCYLHSNLFYIESFMWESTGQDRDDQGYCLVSFKAAVQYMTETDFSHLNDSNQSPDRQASIADAMAVTSLRNDVCTSGQQNSTADAQKRRERQLSRISDVLELTVQEMGQQILAMRQQQIPSVFPDRARKHSSTRGLQDKHDGPNSQLGDFLSALQNDDLDQPFGKQK